MLRPFTSQKDSFKQARAVRLARSSYELEAISLTQLPKGLDMQQIDKWGLYMWRYSEPQLMQILAAMFEGSGLCEQWRIPKLTLSSFLQAVCARYQHNIYHNVYHATQVVHSTFLLRRGGIGTAGDMLSSLDTLALLVAAVAHDIDHPGVNNAFLIATGSPLAITYNDEAVLENHHAASVFRILGNPESNLFLTLQMPEKRQVKRTIVKAILATDMARHSTLIKELTEVVAEQRQVDTGMLVQTILHLADLSNPVQPYKISRRWRSEMSRRISIISPLLTASHRI